MNIFLIKCNSLTDSSIVGTSVVAFNVSRPSNGSSDKGRASDSTGNVHRSSH